VRIPVTALPLGPATLTVAVRSPGGSAVRRSALTLAPTGVGSLRIARSSDTVQPVVDGLLDSVVLTTTGAASAGSRAAVSGTLTVSRGTTIAAVFPVPDGTQRSFTWDGRVAGTVVPGTYTVLLSLRGPQGVVRTRTTTLVVTKQHLPYAVRSMFDVAAGNQQGLAVHDGVFYVGYDNGDGTSHVELYDAAGVRVGTLGPLAIAHAAELSFSTTTGLLYVANGGRTNPTAVQSIDPRNGALHDSFDLNALGPNGLVAVDDANQRLLVFAGTPGAYAVTPVSMLPVSTTDPATGQVTTVPAGTSGPSTRVAVDGMPQGLELVGQQLWIYTSLKKVNHIAKIDLATMLAPTGTDAASDLVWAGEGEGLGYQAALPGQVTGTTLPGWMYVGAHDALPGGPNHLGALVPVTDAD
jgi:hypothetical protein